MTKCTQSALPLPLKPSKETISLVKSLILPELPLVQILKSDWSYSLHIHYWIQFRILCFFTNLNWHYLNKSKPNFTDPHRVDILSKVLPICRKLSLRQIQHNKLFNFSPKIHLSSVQRNVQLPHNHVCMAYLCEIVMYICAVVPVDNIPRFSWSQSALSLWKNSFAHGC